VNRPVLILIIWLTALAGACDGGNAPAAGAAPSIHLPAVPGRPGAGYFELVVRPEQLALVAVSSPRIGRIEMHETMSSGHMTSMRPIDRIPIGEAGRITFAPGGRHLMLFDVDASLRPGDQIALTFRFERGPPRTVQASVRAAGDARP
jgi:periplasmic copper chaperone A